MKNQIQNPEQIKKAEEKKWHALSPEECFAELSSQAGGLSGTEAVRRLKIYGGNELPVKAPTSRLILFLRQFQSPLIYILLIASVVVFFLGGVIDSIVILAVLFFNALVGLFQEGKAENTLAALRKFTKTDSAILRDGREVVLADDEIVPGDIVVLREGDKVPADIRLIEEKMFRIDESALTGESTPVSKNTAQLPRREIPTSEKQNMVFKGTFVMSGNARGVVVATGTETVIGALSEKIASIYTDVPLKENIRSLSRYIGIAVLVASTGVFLLGLFYGNSFTEMFFISVSVAVSLIPEGLPIVITLVLARGVFRMAKQNALIKKLGAVEALGQANIIAVDKTGTITKNELMVEEVFVADKLFNILGSGYEPKGDILFSGEVIDPANHPELLMAGKLAAFSSNARVLFKDGEGVPRVVGDPTEAALGIFAEKTGFPKDEIENEEPQIGDLPFDSKRKYHASLHLVGKRKLLSVMGAHEAVLPLCSSLRRDGKLEKMTEAPKRDLESIIYRMSRKGLRVLVCASIENYRGDLGADPIEKLTFSCIFGLRDVLREGVKQSIEDARALGLRVIMITGDHRHTAEVIAREAGIFREGDKVLSDTDLSGMNETELAVHLPLTSVFARITPEHKFTIIEAARKRGDVIAMTGDGVNDALSLAAADLGIAMGKSGTEVSKEAADIVLLDDNFRSIVLAIEEGRNMYRSIKKVILYLFSTGIGELFTIAGAMLFLLPLPLVPTQILWLNLVTDGFLVVALGLEPREDSDKKVAGVANLPNKSLFDPAMITRIIYLGIIMAAGSVFLFYLYQNTNPLKASTVTLTALAMFQWWNAWNVRSRRVSIFSAGIFSNKYLIGATLIVALLQLFAIYNPFMQKIFSTTALSPKDLFIALILSLTIVIIEEIRKMFYRKRA